MARSAASRGAEFLRTDARRTAKDFENLEHQVLDSIGRAGKSLGAAARIELDAAVHEARKAATTIEAAASTARQAAEGRLGELSRETTDSSVRAARRAVSSILEGAGGFFEGLADAVKEPAPPARKPPAAAVTKSTRPRKP